MFEVHFWLQTVSPSIQKSPQSITHVVLYLCSRVIEIWWYPEYSSKKKYLSYLVIVFKTSFVKGNGYGSFFVATFNFLKSMQIFSLPFFLGITTMGDNHVTSSINWMNPTVNNLSISCLIIVT